MCVLLNLYDFDNTIYSGESTYDFFIFCLIRRPALVKYLHKLILNLIKYKFCLISKDKLEILLRDNLSGVLEICPDFEKFTALFWQENYYKIKPVIRSMLKEGDVVVSASFGFLLRPICEKIGINNLICSEIDIKTGNVNRLCYRENKPELFLEMFPGEKPENFYTDSKNDLPLMKICKNNWFVKGNKIYPVPERILK